jgi:MraZ protein
MSASQPAPLREPGEDDLDLTIDALFRRRGRLAQRLPGYECRAGQRQLAAAVHTAIRLHASLVAEAGTGIGKSLAYLLPATLGLQPVIVSTATRALQDQLVHKDIPLVAHVLERSIRAAPLKGRANYVCLVEYERATRRSTHDPGELYTTADEGDTWTQLTAWITAQGSVANFDFRGKIRKSALVNSMAYRCQNSRKSNFATEPFFIPSSIRELLDKGKPDQFKSVMFVRGQTECLWLYSLHDWEIKLARARETLDEDQSRLLMHFIVSETKDSEIDRSGRICVPRRLRELTGIDEEIVVIGMYDRLEIWSLEEWNSYLARMGEKYETSLHKILNVL